MPDPGLTAEHFEGEDELHYVRFRASNGEIVLVSEGYTRREAAEGLLDLLRKYGLRFEVEEA